MYIVINKTKKTSVNITGTWPMNYLESMLNAGDKVIVISTYSNTIKVPYIDHEYDDYGEVVWEWESYPFGPKNL